MQDRRAIISRMEGFKENVEVKVLFAVILTNLNIIKRNDLKMVILQIVQST